MSFNGSEGGEISMRDASKMTSNYRSQNPNQRIAHFFGREIIEEILAQESCMGIRIYYGLNADGEKELVLVGADSSENDLTNLVADISHPCPNACSTPNHLNS